MAISLPKELGSTSIVVGIDKDKSSQWAVKWAVEYLSKGKCSEIVLVHVRNHGLFYDAEPVPKTGRAPNESEAHQLFLPYRGFIARKGFDAQEVVLQDPDVTNALNTYIEITSIGTIVVGASTRNALTRRFKQADVPTTLEKTAPDFCSVYVIYKGKVQSMRPSNASNSNRESVNSRCTADTSSSDGSYRPYFTKKSTSDNGYNVNNMSSTSPNSGYLSLPAPESPSTSDYKNAISDSLSSYSNSFNYYSTRIMTLLGGQPPAHPPRKTGSFDVTARESYNRDRRRSDETDYFSCTSEGALTPSRFMQSPDPSFKLKQTRSALPKSGRGYSLTNLRSSVPDGFSYNSSSSDGSSESNEYSHDQNFYTSTSFHSSYSASYAMENELDEEIKRVKTEMRKAMDLYKSISNQAATAKHQANYILNREEHTIEDIKVAKQAASLVAELEQLRTKAAMDAANLKERLGKLEAEKRQNIELKNDSRKNTKRSSSVLSMLHIVYNLEEIETATNYFSASQQIGEGGYGPVYRAMLRSTPVAIKVLRPDVSQGLQQFEKEIEVLGRIRHPNMVLLLGSCPHYGCLVYEFMDNGSLEDRLSRKNNTPPIPWRARFKIAAEITTALLFLHQVKPKPMVHRDLKPANILLDSKYTSKISDVGLARLVPASTANEMTQYHMTAAAGTFCYIDPEYQQTGMLGTKSDVYSLGVVLLQLITAKQAMALAYNVEEAIETGKFANMLDPAIPDWPVEQALTLAKLALRCCELRKKDRPDLDTVVLPELNRLRDFALCT